MVYTDIALESKSDVPNLDVSINNQMNGNSTYHGSDLSSSHELHIDSHVTETSELIGGSCRGGEVHIKQNVGGNEVTKTDSDKSMDIKSKFHSETDSASSKEKVTNDRSVQKVTKTESKEIVTNDRSVQEVTNIDKSNSDSDYDDEPIDIDESESEKGSGNGSSSGSSGSSSTSSGSNSSSSGPSGTDDSEKDSESLHDFDDNNSSNKGIQQLSSNKETENDDPLNEYMSSQHILPETKEKP